MRVRKHVILHCGTKDPAPRPGVEWLVSIGVDPGRQTGVGILLDARVPIWAPGERLAAGFVVETVQGDGLKAHREALELALSALADIGAPVAARCAVVVAVEGQYLPSEAGAGQARRAHAQASRKVTRDSVHWEAAAESLGALVLPAPEPNRWRRDVLGRHFGAPQLGRERLKATAQWVAKAVYGLPLTWPDHVAEALCLAGWASVEGRRLLQAREVHHG